MQTQKIGTSGLLKVKIHHVAIQMYSEGGLLGFYRGLAAPLLSLVILNTMTFSTYASLKERFGVARDTTVFGPSENLRVALAAASVGPIAAIISTPFEMVKTQMQLNLKLASLSTGPATASRSSFVHAYLLVKQFGARILYIGHGINTVREVLFLSTYFLVYENTKTVFSSILPHSLAVPFAGGISGATGWFVTFPLDCVKANIQGRDLQCYTRSSALSVARDLLHSRGILGLYAGLMPSIARAFLVSSSRFSAYELSMWILR
jgi:solute carrier family 25 (mitochondrial carnitine/acylcarnitine transporter), member 20/29